MNAEVLKAELQIALPVGSAPDEVSRYLDQKAIEHSGFVGNEQVINAVIRNVEKRALTSRSLRIDFQFDAERKLSSITVSDAFTGP